MLERLRKKTIVIDPTFADLDWDKIQNKARTQVRTIERLTGQHFDTCAQEAKLIAQQLIEKGTDPETITIVASGVKGKKTHMRTDKMTWVEVTNEDGKKTCIISPKFAPNVEKYLYNRKNIKISV